MGNYWLCPRFAFHCNYIDLPMVNFMCSGIMLCGVKHVFAFTRRDVVLRKEIFTGCESLNFNKDRDITLLCDDVNFPVRCADISCDDLQPALHYITDG